MIPARLAGTDGAATVATRSHQACEVMVAQAARYSGIFVITSSVAGVGKSFSACAAAAATGRAVSVVRISPQASVMAANTVLLDSVGVRVYRQDGVADTTRELRDLLADQPRIVIVDAAESLSGDVLAHLRILHTTSQFTLGFVGHRRLLSRAATQPELFDDADRYLSFPPLTPAEVAAVIPGYHPLFAAMGTDRLLAINQAFCHGRWKRWAQLLRTALLYANATGEMDEASERHCLVALGWKPSRRL